jgi:hypothetical protein
MNSQAWEAIEVETETEPGPEQSVRSPLRLERRVDGQLWASVDGESSPVKVRRCFPWSKPDELISLRTEDDDEFALVGRPGELDERSRDALETALGEAGFVLEILQIMSCEEEIEIRTWRVRTRQGARSFQTRRDDWPRELPGGGLLIRDVAGDVYRVAQPGEMDAKSRELIWAFVD